MADASTTAGKAATAADKAQGAAATDTDDIRAQLSTLRKDVETLQRLLRETAEQKVNSARAQATDTFDDYRAEARRQARHASDTAQYYQHEAEAAVRNNPTAALGIATGIGFLAGLILSRR